MADTEKTKVAEGTKVALPDISPMIAKPQEGEQLGEGQKLARQVKNGEQWGTAPVAKPQDSVQPAGDASGRGGYVPGSFYTDYWEKNNPYKKRVEDAEEQMERMRRNKLFATIGSGFDAFHQAYANMRGVKPMESPKVADKYLAQYNALKKYRDDNQDAFNKAYIEAKKNDRADEQLNIRNTIENRRQDRLDRETKIRETKAEAYRGYQESLTSKNEEMAAYYHAKWQALEEGKSVEEALKRAKTAQAEAAARLANVRADAGGFAPKSGNTGGGRGGRSVLPDYEVIEEEIDKNGNVKKTKRKRRTVKNAGSGSGSGGSTGSGGGSKKPMPTAKKSLP